MRSVYSQEAPGSLRSRIGPAAGRQGENAVAGKTPVKPNRYVHLSGARKSVDRAPEAKTAH
jgi:hypothetical protein